MDVRNNLLSNGSLYHDGVFNLFFKKDLFESACTFYNACNMTIDNGRLKLDPDSKIINPLKYQKLTKVIENIITNNEMMQLQVICKIILF